MKEGGNDDERAGKHGNGASDANKANLMKEGSRQAQPRLLYIRT